MLFCCTTLAPARRAERAGLRALPTSWLALAGAVVLACLPSCSGTEDVIGYGRAGASGSEGGEAGWTSGWSEPLPIAALLANGVSNQNPSVTADALELYFSTTRPGAMSAELWRSQRSSALAAWGAPTVVPELVDSGAVTPAIAPDGLSLYIRLNNQIGIARRNDRSAPFGAPAEVPELSSTSVEGSARIDDSETRIVFGRQTPTQDFNLFRSQRSSASEQWAEPTALSELNGPGYESEPQLLDQGRILIFGSTLDGKSGFDIAWTERASEADQFAAPQRFESLCSAADDTDPFFIPDRSYVVFSSRRSGSQQIYESHRSP